ncbi:glutamyl-tRNA amidotransferase [Metamycoplasma faucium]|uniref:Glutamyl-tRNA amidotransferase n=1 Tax=Metamycoplasma faucium TaxID=56142 RepID=A0ABZ2TQP9_9BACT
MDEKKVKELVKKIYLNPSKEVIDLTIHLYKKIDKGLEKFENDSVFQSIDKFMPISRVDESSIKFEDLREDYEDETFKLSKQNIFKNSNNVENDLIFIKKVLNDN